MDFSSTSVVSRGSWLLRKWSRKIWVRASLFSLAAIATALLAGVVGPYIEADLQIKLAADSVGGILNILASSMLAVTTFSLSIMVSAYSSATSNVTPHSTKLLLSDSVAQNTLATFIGSFLFSIVGIIGLAAGLYSDTGRIVLFFATLVVILVITTALLRWIEQLGKFGRVGDTIDRVEAAATPPICEWGRSHRLGARPAVAIPASALPLAAESTGHIQHIDMEKLAKLADDHDLTIHIVALPGAYVHAERAIAQIEGRPDDTARAAIAACFSIGRHREYDQDPRFGLIVLSEIASRALSPAVNDPGTAIEVIGAGLRTLLAYGEACAKPADDRFARLHGPNLEVADLFDAFFNPIARDGAALVEVQLRLQFALEALAGSAPALFGAAACEQSARASRRGAEAMTAAHDRAALAQRARWAGAGWVSDC
ncbi:DUF2254 domain-containing protein [Sphingomonas qomolangmaensis]|uniref:DUF2254 domain-containing protein n=1 Tax=Sphingomonas qomolangmaensis TaxID=2918765 RepID=A0ABY5L976_9SPHN|nr:DUF2254 domain-containing protein [Sphingomonas qomolangmaensis]UUL82128.1 DUF2254 domain-containing protein [Sphingomonas qomolangmaensis]